VVKRIWTPAWVLYSGGWCFFLLGASYAVADIGKQKWLFPLVVIGTNSIAAYCVANVCENFIGQNLWIHFAELFKLVPPLYQVSAHGAAVLLVMWLILWWMHRRKIFLRI
jgi:predicted acyltransferase